MTSSRHRLISVVLALAVTGGISTTLARQSIDRTKPPPIGKTPELRVPVWTRTKLPNGAELIVSEKRDLPLISFTITLLGGSSQFEPAGRRGLAGMAASMLSEGTAFKDGEAISNALQLLGTNVSASIGSESGSIGFVSTTGKFAGTLDILADMLVNSTFPAASLERLRAQRLVALNQAKAQSGAIAGRVFPRVLYGDGHPYGQSPTEASVTAITRDEVIAFHRAYFKPGRAVVTVVGDVTLASMTPIVSRGLAAWAAGGSKPDFAYPVLPERRSTTIFLVNKPGSAQSTFSIGLPGPPRNTVDYFAIQVMNTILGGMFQSRLNANLREEKGYSYGVSSGFSFGKGPGAFRAGGDIATPNTDAGLTEFMKELRGILGSRPITVEELTTAKESLVQRLPGTFASVSAINRAITDLWTQDLPDSYYHDYAKAIGAVTSDDVLRVARSYVDPDHLAIVIVGDLAVVEGPLKATGNAPVIVLSVDGDPIGKN